jgi:hypothetical protein
MVIDIQFTDKIPSITETKNQPAIKRTGLYFLKSALTLLDAKETDGFMGYGLLYRVRRSFMVFSLDLEIGFRTDWTGFFGFGRFFSDLDSNVVCF